ncbi:MAG: aldehyde dehydrogenase family protein, partial [Actinobacteria bacterium]|nr:aldehyde dehydrogenase family protein [Actinomycetota bacterium]
MDAATAVQTSAARPFLLGGDATGSSESRDVVYPYDGSVAATVALADADASEEALALATAAREGVAELAPFERAAILLATAELVLGRAEELARQITLETG